MYNIGQFCCCYLYAVLLVNSNRKKLSMFIYRFCIIIPLRFGLRIYRILGTLKD
uniref:Macaca fascicularis brain cDNA clone: QmoA-10323, similar to human ectonucleotide pyrophosphatase/phosphodiesterase 4(putative function) (ENPP4), mRNA, RefSeq: XM_376503.1 n=1 Tax=Macaca fascicularis TaxID=9541 RepID=I7GN04_MACFA|nr:unnamed protein product [Macaca fascicularis]